jgi:hypothetical protein
MALAQGKQMRPLAHGAQDYIPQKGSTVVFGGGVVAADTSNRGVPGATALKLVVLGLAKTNRGIDRYDATGLADGVNNVTYEEGTFPMKNSGGADAFATTDPPGIPVFMVDDETAAKTNGGETRSPMGRLHHVDATGVWVTMGKNISMQLLEQAAQTLVRSIPIVLSKHANGSIAARFTPGFAGRIKKLSAYVIDPVTTGAKLGTFTPAIGGVATTGGALALTSANCTPVGAKVDGSAVTAGYDFADTDEITLVASAVTAFVEGQVVAELYLERVL